ncbi:efflux RND transporter periplasmic adaptor subunit [Candidatus Sulfidibacterium hydrothermale]|uniref:efflux RND transporter periplasmic adaptor subunit n=1 Tax=Candidatus Sulfidibacterium hydrothermale TaxID=2875962 RepID=UPI001F0A8E9F|nr:efflux RND transporter periplasmic adaptor subunit [Candidatus Sulfidibacterium hydrothermale]UBM63121.1 efflux RND transporter periplasmic adaptor subunit [Candidatus Sulfidibacterium hydrothermale]
MTKRFFIKILPIGFILLLFLVSCGHKESKVHEKVHVKTETATATVKTFYERINGFGTIQAVKTLDLEAKFGGIVHFKNMQGHIKKGMVIYTINGPEIDLKREKLEKALTTAQTQYLYYKQFYEAKKKLAEKSFLSRIEFEKVTSDLQKAQNNLNNAQYELNYFLTMTRYKAPFSGYLDNLQVPQGEDAAVGQLLGTFQDDDHVKLVAPFYGNINRLPHNKIKLQIGQNTFEGKIIYKEKAVNPSTGGHTLWITLQDSLHLLKCGNYVSFSFLVNRHKAVSVPQTAVIRQNNHFYVMGLVDHHYQKISVIPGPTQNGQTEIKKGLKNGMVVLTEGAFEVFYGNLSRTMKVDD